MRTIERTSQFKQDYKRERKGRHRNDVEGLIVSAIDLLVIDEALPQNYCDHPLSGKWNEHRECHLKPDLLLIYKKLDDDILRLVRIGSHNELFG